MRSAYLFALLSCLVAAGCSVQVKSDPEEAARLKQSASETGQKISEATRNAADSAQKSARQAGETAPIWLALQKSKDVDTSHLQIETRDKSIYLSGSLPSEAMHKKAVDMVNALKDSDYKVVDQVVVGKPSNGKPETRITDDQKPQTE